MSLPVSSARAAELSAHYALCESAVREKDRDSWLAALFAPAAQRRFLHAVHAFTLEITEARKKVTQPVLGEMRLRWWGDMIVSPGEDGSNAHPVADALLDTITQNRLDRQEFDAFLDTHVADFYDDPMESVAALLAYCSRAYVLPLRWCAQCLGATMRDETGAALEDAGVALGLTRILCRLPNHDGSRAFLPLDLLARHDVSLTDIQAGVDSPKLRAVLEELRNLARARFEAAKRVAPRVDEATRTALLATATAPLYLERMEAKSYHPFRPFFEPPAWRRQWRLWRAARVGL
jgi:phytoene synthase